MTRALSRRCFLRDSALTLGAAAVGRGAACSRSRSRPPNILFVLTDDQRWDALGCAGNRVIQTPHMDRMAASGIRFVNAFTTTPICAASRASIFTGLYERTHGYTFTKPPLSRRMSDLSYPALLRRTGYRTGFVGKLGIALEPGAAEEMFDWHRFSGLQYWHEVDGVSRHLTDIHGDRALEFIETCGTEQPFCLSISFWAPHADDGTEEQYFWPTACDDLYHDQTIPVLPAASLDIFEQKPDFLKESLNRVRWRWRFDTAEKYQRMVKGYYRMISGVDAVVGRLMAVLERRGLVENTVVILASDNGYFLGERGFAGKWLMHEPSIRIPFLVMAPGIPRRLRGTVRNELVLNLDLPATLLNLAGAAPPSRMQGRSLVPLLKGKDVSWREAVMCEHLWDKDDIPRSECVRTHRWKHIRYPGHSEYEELYDLGRDGREAVNLAADPGYAAVKAGLREKGRRFFEGLAVRKTD